jgi:GT2 family glycosyltransferase
MGGEEALEKSRTGPRTTDYENPATRRLAGHACLPIIDERPSCQSTNTDGCVKDSSPHLRMRLCTLMTKGHDQAGSMSEPRRRPRRIVSDLTLFIPTVGRPELDRCVKSIARGTAWPAQIIVVDQGENPTVIEWLNAARASGLDTVHLLSTDRSASSARNQAIERVTTTFAVAIDDDCVPATDWLECMERCLRRDPGALITGRCLPAGGGMAPTIVTSVVPRLHTRPSMRFPSPLASGNMGFALKTARRLGPFDEKLAQAEDNDWAYRALRAGIPIVYAPEVVVEHVHWRSDDESAAVSRAYAKSQGAFYGKHLRQGDWSMVPRTADYLLRNGHLLIRGLVKNDRAKSATAYVKMKCLISGVVSGLRGRGSR